MHENNDYMRGRSGHGIKDYSNTENLRGWRDREDLLIAVASNPRGFANGMVNLALAPFLPLIFLWKALQSRIGRICVVLLAIGIGTFWHIQDTSPATRRARAHDAADLAHSAARGLDAGLKITMITAAKGTALIDQMGATVFGQTGYRPANPAEQGMCDHYLNALAKAHPDWWGGSPPQIGRNYEAELFEGRLPTEVERPSAMLKTLADHIHDHEEASGKRSNLAETASMGAVRRCVAIERTVLATG